MYICIYICMFECKYVYHAVTSEPIFTKYKNNFELNLAYRNSSKIIKFRDIALQGSGCQVVMEVHLKK